MLVLLAGCGAAHADGIALSPKYLRQVYAGGDFAQVSCNLDIDMVGRRLCRFDVRFDGRDKSYAFSPDDEGYEDPIEQFMFWPVRGVEDFAVAIPVTCGPKDLAEAGLDAAHAQCRIHYRPLGGQLMSAHTEIVNTESLQPHYRKLAGMRDPENSMICAENVAHWYMTAKPGGDYSREQRFSRAQVRAIIEDIPPVQRERLIDATKSLFAKDAVSEWTQARYEALPERIQNALMERSANAFGVVDCGDPRIVGEYLQAHVQGALLRPYEGNGALLQPGATFGAGEIVVSAVILELNSVPYDFDALLLALSR